MWHRSFYLESEVLLNMIIDLHLQEEFIAWVLLGQICFCAGDRARDADNCFARAESLHAARKETRSSASHELTSSLLMHPFSLSHSVLKCRIPNNPYVDTALLLLDLHLPKEAEAILSQQHAVLCCSIDFKLCIGRVQELFGEYSEAEKVMKEAWGSDDTQATVWMLLGHLYHTTAQHQLAIDAYEKMVQYGEEQPFFMLGCLELGKSYLYCHQFEKAKRTFLQISSSHPSSSSWLGAGMSFYEEGDMVSAEAAFVEGNVLDPWNFKLWAYLALVCLRTNRMEEAEFAFYQAMQLHAFLPLVIQMAEYFHEKGKIRVAEKALQKACEEAEGAVDSEVMQSGCWQEKLSFVKRVLRTREECPWTLVQ